MAHYYGPYASSASKKLSAKRKFVCLSGLKEGVFFSGDGDERVFHSTYRATRYLIASSTRVSHLGDQPSRAHSPSNVEKSIYFEKNINAPEASACIPDRAHHDFRCRWDNNAQTSSSYIDTQNEEGPLPTGNTNAQSDYCSSQEFNIPASPEIYTPYLEIQEPCGVSEFCTVHPEAPDLQPEVKSWDSEGLCNGDANASFCMIENVCSNDGDSYSVVLQENDFMSACINGYITKIFDAKDSFCLIDFFCDDNDNDRDSLVLEKNDIRAARTDNCSTTIFEAEYISPSLEYVCNNNRNDRDIAVLEENNIMSMSTCDCLTRGFDPLKQKNEVVYTGDSTLFDLVNVSVDCWSCFNPNSSMQSSKLSAQRWCGIWKLFNCWVISSICGTLTREKLFLQPFLTGQVRLTLHRLFMWLNRRNLDWEVDFLDEQSIVHINIYLRVCYSRYLPARGQRVIAASCFVRQFLCKQLEKAAGKRHGHNKKMNVQVIVQDCLNYHLRGQRTHVLLRCFLLEHNSADIERACWYPSISSSKVGDSFASMLSHLLELREEDFSRRMESPSDDFDGFLGVLQGSSEHKEQDSFESNQSSNNLLSEMSCGRALNLADLLEVRDACMTSSSEFPCGETDVFIEDPKNSLSFPSCRSANKVDDWTSVSTDQIEECLDTCLYNIQDHPTCVLHDFTPKLEPLDHAVMGNSPMIANNSSADDGSQSFDVCPNGNKNNLSCLPVAEPSSHTLFISMSFDAEELRFSVPYKGIPERQSKEKLKHFAEVFLLQSHIRRQQRRAQQAPPYPPKGPVYKYQDASSGDLKTNPDRICSVRASHENNNGLARTLASSATDLDCSVGADVVIDIVGLEKYIESRCSQVNTSTDAGVNSIIYADMPLIAGQVVISNFSAVIVTIIAIIVYTKTLLDSGLAWVGARAQKEEDK